MYLITACRITETQLQDLVEAGDDLRSGITDPRQRCCVYTAFTHVMLDYRDETEKAFGGGGRRFEG